jgi:DNA-binding transcriptional MerR regulator
MDTHYTVRQAIEMVGVKAYVLRYWEEELQLEIHRNEMGHRYYTGYDIQLFMNIKELKNRGLQLRAIRNLIPQMPLKEFPIPDKDVSDISKLKDKKSGESGDVEMKDQKSKGRKLKNQKTKAQEAENPKEKEQPSREAQWKGRESKDPKADEKKIIEFQEILERLIEQEMQTKNEEEERCRTLDLAIRRQQVARREAAAAGGRRSSRKQRHT